MTQKTPKKDAVTPYINRELSWLDFNTRVLEEAYEKDNPAKRPPQKKNLQVYKENRTAAYAGV